jgi:hypothetical protein
MTNFAVSYISCFHTYPSSTHEVYRNHSYRIVNFESDYNGTTVGSDDTTYQPYDAGLPRSDYCTWRCTYMGQLQLQL